MQHTAYMLSMIVMYVLVLMLSCSCSDLISHSYLDLTDPHDTMRI